MVQKLKAFLPHLIAVAFFVAISAIYFYPAFTGHKLKQGDITHFRGMSKEIVEYRRMYGEEPLWTNSMFGGMPAYQISVRYPNDIMGFVDSIISLGLPTPVRYLFLYMLGFYILLLAFRLRPGLAAVGAVAFALSTYLLIIIEAGHNSKAHAIAYLAPVLAGIIWTYRGKLLLGGAITAFFVALQINANHVQITYYFAFLVLFYALAKAIEAIRENTLPLFLKASGVLVLAGMLGVLTNANSLYTTYNYGKYTTRGATELTVEPDGSSNEANVTEGLNRDYVTQWSYGIGESFSLLFPNASGGPSGALIDENTQKEDPQLYNQLASGYQATQVFPNSYWGDQPFTSGPVYVGAVVFLLFLLGTFFVNGPIKWALVITALLTLALSWGKNFMGLTDFFLDYVPGYDKFRAVTIVLSITELVFPLLGFLFLKKLFEQPGLLYDQRKKFLAVAGSLAALLILFVALPASFFDFLSIQEATALNAAMGGEAGAQVLDYANALKAGRITAFRSDAFRSLAFVLLAGGLLWFFSRQKLKPTWLVVAMAVLVLFDLWPVDKRYLNNKKVRGRFVQWQPVEETKSAYSATAADMAILDREMAANPRVADAVKEALADYQSTGRDRKALKPGKDELNDIRFAALRFNTDFRVLPLQGTFQDARTAYFHKSIGGYHGAKLKRIQEVYDFNIVPEMSALYRVLQQSPTAEKVNAVLQNANVLNMLNAKYIIYNLEGSPIAIKNDYALGSAWFVENIIMAVNADDEIKELGLIDTRTEAVVDERFSDQLEGFAFRESADAAIAVETHLPNYIKYIYNSPVPQTVVFSEMYYDDGWNAFIDGEKTDYFRADYLLRGMVIPAGQHEIEWKFEPKSYAFANVLSLGAGIVVLVLVGFAGFWEYKNESQPLMESEKAKI